MALGGVEVLEVGARVGAAVAEAVDGVVAGWSSGAHT